jgi:hypothetical protein
VLVHATEDVQVWTTRSGVPAMLLRDGVRYRVSDRPTRWLGRDDAWDFGPVDAGVCGHPTLWRFQATPIDGDAQSVVMDVVATGRGWVLLGFVR